MDHHPPLRQEEELAVRVPKGQPLQPRGAFNTPPTLSKLLEVPVVVPLVWDRERDTLLDSDRRLHQRLQRAQEEEEWIGTAFWGPPSQLFKIVRHTNHLRWHRSGSRLCPIRNLHPQHGTTFSHNSRTNNHNRDGINSRRHLLRLHKVLIPTRLICHSQ